MKVEELDVDTQRRAVVDKGSEQGRDKVGFRSTKSVRLFLQGNRNTNH